MAESTQDGTLQRVTVELLGSALTVAADVDDATLSVDWALDFSEDGGLLRLGGVEYVYTGVDKEADTIHLATPVTEAAEAGAPVDAMTSSGNQAQRWVAWVESSDADAEPIPAVIPSGVTDFTEGEDQQGAAVSYVAEDGGTFRAVSLLDTDRRPPDPGVPTEAPDESPAITVTGLASGLMVTTEPVDASTVLDYYIDGELVREGTRSTAEFLTLDGDGDPLVVDTDYSVTVVARNVVDAAAPSDAVVKRLDPGMTDEIVAGLISAGGVVTGELTIGNITINPDDGFTAPQANDGLVHIPTNGVDPVSLLGVKLSAESADFSDNVSIKGEFNKLEGGLTAANGVTKPLAAPTVSADWPAPLAVDPDDGVPRGLWGDATHWYVPVWESGHARVDQFDKTTGALTDTSGDIGTLEPLGITQVSGDWYVLSTSSGNYYVRAYDSSWALVDSWVFTPTGTSPRAPTISANGASPSSVRITYWTTVSGQARIVSQAYSADTGVVSGSALTVNTTPDKRDMRGVYYGTADFGSTRLVVGYENGLRVYDSTGAGAEHFSPLSDHRGLAWDGSDFYGINTLGEVYQYSPIVSGTSRSVTYTWYDSNATGGTHETEASPATSFTQAARKWMRVTTPPADDQGGTDDPDSVRIYIGNNRQADLGAGVWTALYGAAGGSIDAPLTNDFPGALTPGYFKSQSGAWRFNGDDTWDLGPLSGTATTVAHSGDIGWTNLTLGTGWVTVGGATPQYRVKDGIVHWRGTAERTSGTSTTLGTISDAAARPAQTRSCGTRVAAGYGALTIGSGGTVATASGVANGTDYFLDGIAPYPND